MGGGGQGRGAQACIDDLPIGMWLNRVFPSLDTIARMAMVSKRTVLNAIAWLALYGFLDRLRQAKFNPNLKSSWFTSVMQIISNFTMITVIRTGAAHS